MMTAKDGNRKVFSSFTCAILEDSGWYQTNREKTQLFFWGLDKGCTFYSYQGCPKAIEIC